MAKIPKEIQEFVKGQMAWVATAAPDGVPNATPKGTVRIIDDEHIVFADLFSLKTRENLEKNPKVAVTVIDFQNVKGYQFKGTAELISSGPVFDEMVEWLKQRPKKFGVPKYVVKITVDSIFDQSVGPHAGKRLE